MAYAGKVALVTGGASGMGRLAAQIFSRTGAAVAALDVNEEGLAETAKGHDSIRTYKVDITDYQAVEAAVKQIETDLGPLDRVYNAAAIMPFGKLLEQDAAVMHRLMSINFGGLVNISKTTVPGMLQRRRGDFVSFASMAGIIPTLLTGAYSASKSAVVTYTETLYHENRDQGVRFAMVCPPAVATPLLQQGRDTAWPKMLDDAPPIEPQEVIDRIELALDKEEFLVFPGKGTKIGWIVRRLAPGLIWKQVHKVEGF